MKYTYRPKIDPSLEKMQIPSNGEIFQVLSKRSRQITSGEKMEAKSSDASEVKDDQTQTD